MWALEQPLTAVRDRASVVPRVAAILLVGTLAGGLVVASAGDLTAADLRVLVTAVLHGTLLTVALGVAASASRGRWSATGPAVVTIALIALGAASERLDPRGALLYLPILFWLCWLGARGRLAPIGIRPAAPFALLVGALAGIALGSHVLISAASTLGYRVRGDSLAPWGLALAYDAGLSVASAELFFRGVLFDRLQRQVSFAAGAGGATVACLARFLPDPRLPAALEVLAGAALYVTLLSVVNSWLFWWSGSLLPALLSAIAFFAVYRLLAI
jgi:hypothetical protein